MLNVANFFTFFALFVLLVRSLWNLAINQTTIETWEVERHEVLLRRARQFGGYLDGPDGQRIRIVRQEFPYDIGIFRNIAQGMGSSNVGGPRSCIKTSTDYFCSRWHGSGHFQRRLRW
jgi:palmitoyltransferase